MKNNLIYKIKLFNKPFKKSCVKLFNVLIINSQSDEKDYLIVRMHFGSNP
jgi:hypothetical protein